MAQRVKGLVGSGMPAVIEKLIYIKKPFPQRISRDRLLLKKRNWLIRQIDPLKRFAKVYSNQMHLDRMEFEESLQQFEEEAKLMS